MAVTYQISHWLLSTFSFAREMSGHKCGARDISGFKLMRSFSMLTCGVSQDFVFCTFTFYIYASISFYILSCSCTFAFAFDICSLWHFSRVRFCIIRVFAFAYIVFVIFPASRSFNLVIEGHSSSD